MNDFQAIADLRADLREALVERNEARLECCKLQAALRDYRAETDRLRAAIAVAQRALEIAVSK